MSETFLLHSRPAATKKIYLDFDGHVTTNTLWNTDPNPDVPTITTAVYSFEGGNSFSNNELTAIQEIFDRVAECYSPFDVDVTTEAPPVADLINSGAGDTRWGIRVCIGDTTPNPAPGAGGVAWIGSFNWDTDTPTFVFPSGLGPYVSKYVADACVHEVGHTLGLIHDGTNSPPQSYYTGHGFGPTGWAPHMGVGYFQTLIQWSKGEYFSADNQEDDLNIITTQNGFTYRPDDFASTQGTAVAIAGTPASGGVFNVSQSGVIERRTDSDWFKITAGTGTLNLSAVGGPANTMLDIQMDLYSAGGALVVSSNPLDDVVATISRSVVAGTYYLKIDGVGKGDPLATGYTDYGSLGQYRIAGSYPIGSPPPPASNVTVNYNAGTKTLALTGDAGANTVTVSLRSGRLTIEGASSTKITNANTAKSNLTSTSYAHSGQLVLNANLNDGNDAISMIGVDSSTTDIKLGNGNDRASLSLCKVVTLKVDGGAGTDSLITTSTKVTTKTVTGVP